MPTPSPERRTAPRRIWERALPIVILFVVAATVLAYCGNSGTSRLDATEDLGRAPSTTSPEDKPFTLAEPSESGQTTLPPSYFERGGAPTASTPSPPTTTLPALDAPGGDPVCQGALLLGEMFRLGEQITGDFPRVQSMAVEKLRGAAQQFATAGGVYAPGAALLAERANKVEQVTEEDEIGPLVKSIRLMTDPELAAVSGELQAHLAQSCPSLTQ